MDTIALLVTGIVSAVALLCLAASWQFVVLSLMRLGLPQDAAVFGPVPTVMLIGLLIDCYRNNWRSS